MVHLILWWAALQVLGIAALPWAAFLFRSLPDRGYGLSKVLGLLLLCYAYWAFVVAGLLPNATPALLLVLALYLAASASVGWQGWKEILLFVRQMRGLLLLEEGIFTGAFLLFAAFRMLAPDIYLTGSPTVITEYPMDLAFLTASLRSPGLPPEDPWLAGHPIGYYYLGYLVLGLPARLAGAPATVAYNLALATVFALAAVGAFSVASNAARLAQLGRRDGVLPALAGVAALLLLLVAGNLVGVGATLARLRVGQGGALSDPNWWFWPSRVIADGTYAEPIDEFPAFSLVLGDLHPHLMAIPFALLALGVALAWLARSEAPGARWALRQPAEAILTALVVGGLGPINSWDLPVYLGMLMAAILVRRLGQDPGRTLVADVLGPALALAGLALLLFLPFYLGLGGAVQGVVPLERTGTRPVHYLLLWGPLLGAAVVPTVAAAWGRLKGRALAPRGLLVVALIALAPAVLWTLVVGVLLGGRGAGFDFGPAPGLLDIAGRWALLAPAMALLALALVALAPSWREGRPLPGRTFGHLLLAGAVMLIIVPELFFARDLFGTRMNTVFKLHYQAWVLLSLSAALGLAWLLAQPRPRRTLAQLAAGGGTALVLLVGLLALGYGPLAAATRVRHSPGPSRALDGLAFYRQRYPEEAAAIEWLRSRPAGRPGVVLEAVGGDFSEFGRVAAITGMPTPIGWEGHELQWRSGYALLAGRRADVAAIYAGEDPERARSLLTFYEVDYVFVGRLERQAYGPEVAERMERLLSGEVAYRAGEVVVFRVARE